MKDFLILFWGREGSSALVATLERFPMIDLVGFEPFDDYVFLEAKHGGLGKDMPGTTLVECLKLIYDRSDPDAPARLRALYRQYRNRGLNDFKREGRSVGFKMRIFPESRWSHREEIFEVLSDHRVVAFVTIRRDVFRWALSTFRPAATQFRVARGEVSVQELPKLTIDPRELARRIEASEQRNRRKEALLGELEAAGVEAFPLYYEDFCENKPLLFRTLLNALGVRLSDQELSGVLAKEIRFKKVHSENIREFVSNSEELLDRFEPFES